MPDSLVAEGVIAALQLTGLHGDTGEAGADRESGCLATDMHHRNQLFALNHLDHRTTGIS